MKYITRYYYLLPLLVVLLPLSTWFELTPSQTGKTAISPPPLPAPVSEKNDKLLHAILKHNLWDKKRGQLVTGSADGSITATKQVKACHLKGIAFAQMQPPQAMFNCGGRLILSGEGDILPDKSELREIHADHVVLERAGDIRREYLFGKKEKPPADEPRIPQGKR